MAVNRVWTATLAGVILLGLTNTSYAHHSVLHYDGKTEIKISGVVTRARFGFPHSIYRIEVAAEDGAKETWVLSTEDPRDAERLGFADELKQLKVGDQITVVGWPHQFIEREVRGHQLHYPDGRIVMMRRGNYIWPKDILRLDRFVMNPQNIVEYITEVDPTSPTADQLLQWIIEDDHVARAAYEVSEDRARLIALQTGGTSDFPGVDDLLMCHTTRANFKMEVNLDNISESDRQKIAEAGEYIAEYNRVLSRWWEQERASCD